MATFRVHKTANYTVMSNHHLRNKDLSLKAKGLLSVMLSLPDDWDYSVSGLSAISKEGVKAVRSGLKELEEEGYLIRSRINCDDGTFDYIYDIYEQPHNQKGYAVEGHAENGMQRSKEKTNTKKEDKIDKQDKRKSEDFHDASAINNEKPNGFSKVLIEAGYIDEDDIFMNMYNHLFHELCHERGFELVRSSLWYFIKNLRIVEGKALDANGEPIENKHAYLKASLNDGLRTLENLDERNKKIEELLNYDGALEWFKEHVIEPAKLPSEEDDEEMPY